MRKNILFTQLVQPVFILICFLAIVLILGAVGYYIWLEATGEMDVRRLEAQVAVLQAQAQADRAAAEKANADAVLAPAEAAALTVERQSAVMTYWGVLTPFGLIFVVCAMTLLGITTGAAGMMWIQGQNN